MENMMDPNFIDYYIINYAIPSIITIENRYQIDFGNPDHRTQERNYCEFILTFLPTHSFCIFASPHFSMNCLFLNLNH